MGNQLVSEIKTFSFSSDQEIILNNYEQGFASVLATPGAGKTTIITHLIKNLITEKKVPPYSILVLTLTESAAKEFRERTVKLLKENNVRFKHYPEFSTIHSFCNRYLSRYYENYNEMNVLPDTAKNEIIEELLIKNGLPLQELNDEGNVEISYLEVFRDSIIPLFRKDKHIMEKFHKVISLDPKDIRKKIGSISNYHLKCFYHIPNIVQQYETYLKEQNYIDFDTMITGMYKILLDNPEVSQEISQRYQYILEDESQDSNLIQSEILKLIAQIHGNYLRVGDPNQSIFTTFTGADYKALMEFSKNNKEFNIRQSNRSHQSIIDVANHLLDKFPDSFPASEVKVSSGDYNPLDGLVSVQKFHFLDNEIDFICENAERILSHNSEHSVAVITRTNYQASEFYKRIIDRGFEAILHGTRDEDFFNNNAVKKITAITGFALHPYKFDLLKEVLLFLDFKESEIFEFFQEDDKCFYQIKALSQEEFIYLGDENLFERMEKVAKNLYQLSNYIYYDVSEFLELVNNIFIHNPEEKSSGRILNKMWLRAKPGIRNTLEFYYWLQKHRESKIKQELNVEEEKQFSSPGVIHLLTVHKAKGLQWDGVFLPNFSSWDYKDDSWRGPREDRDIKSAILSVAQEKSRQQIRKELAQEEVYESRRVAYVAITRAKKELYLTCSTKGLSTFKDNNFAEILNDLENLIYHR